MKNTSKPVLILKGIGKDYLVDKKPFTALSGIDLAFPETGFVSILGPSGCGKTTLLNIIGGLDRATYGELYIEGKSTKDYKDKDWDAFRNRRVGFVFQSYNLIEHYTVLENVETPLLLAGEKPEERKRKALEALKGVGLEGIEKKRPNQLSGGQMQRVAIARAIASNPDIIMADEPTGALDSKSSKAVAEILKAASEKTLVILVTHNRELAEKYSDRIIEMEDGKIVSDSAPLPIDENLEPGAAKDKTSMGFWTALVSSAKNIVSKKVRTLLTAIASSVGIAGVALVLSLNNGFSDYVSSVEGQMASSVPITIEKRTMGWESTSEGTQTGIEYPDDDTLYAYESTGYSYVVKTNDLSREYVDYVKALVEDQNLIRQNLASDVLIQRDNLYFNILTSTTLDENDEDAEFFMVDQYRSASSTTYRNAIASATNLPSTIFHSLYGVGEPGDVSSQYDLIYGEYPTSPNDLVLIVDTYNQVNVSTLRALGIIDESEGGGTAISFQDIVEKKVYKAYLQKDFYSLEDPYEYSDACYENVRLNLDVSTGRLRASASGRGVKTGKAYTCPGTSSDSYKDFYFGDHNAIELRIAGILRPSRNSFLTTMPCSIGYLPSLMDMFMAEDNEVKDTLAEAQRTGWYVPAEKNDIDGLENLNSVLASVSIDTNLDSSTVSNLFDQLADCLSYCSFLRSDTDTNYKNRLTPYGQLSYSRRVGADYKENDVALLVDPILAGDYSTLPEVLGAFVSSGFFDSSSENLTIMDFIAYAEAYSLVTSILVFPASMTTKEALRNYLDAYNEGKESSKQVTYMDAMSDFTDAIGEMVSVISIILVVFASISLVVSSIMMAVITYVSVLERTKEIGILRACGARKKDVGRLFEAECVIVGAIAGLIGIFVALLLGWPLNVILQASFSSMVQLPSMAVLSWWIALILLLVGIVLALVSGLIPARIAARKDPVVALRSE